MKLNSTTIMVYYGSRTIQKRPINWIVVCSYCHFTLSSCKGEYTRECNFILEERANREVKSDADQSESFWWKGDFNQPFFSIRLSLAATGVKYFMREARIFLSFFFFSFTVIVDRQRGFYSYTNKRTKELP